MAAKKADLKTLEPKTALLEGVKARIESIVDEEFRPEVMADFRGIVQEILERWSGKDPVLVFLWDAGIHAIILGPEESKAERVHQDRRLVEVAIEMAYGGEAMTLEIEDGGARIEPIHLLSVHTRVGGHYRDKTPLASLGF